jgi:hypothetical protein
MACEGRNHGVRGEEPWRARGGTMVRKGRNHLWCARGGTMVIMVREREGQEPQSDVPAISIHVLDCSSSDISGTRSLHHSATFLQNHFPLNLSRSKSL